MKNKINGANKLENNFGALRLFFAILVILSHSPELIDGNRSREILTNVFHTLSFGELAVDGFFLISGYLITKSFQETRQIREYLVKRILRIYPGFLVSFLLSILIGLFVGGHLAASSVITIMGHMILLRAPEMPGAFAGSPYPDLNGSMWTIAYEFRCYLLVIFLGITGLLSKRIILTALTGGALILSSVLRDHILVLPWWRLEPLIPFIGEPASAIHFGAVFGCGALFYLYGVRYDWRLAILAGFGLIALMFSLSFSEAAVAIFGGYVLFWFTFNVKSRTLSRIGQTVDLSYGVYLYAWPIQKLLIWLNPAVSPWMVFILATATASFCALGSWWLVEKPFLDLKAAFVSVVAVSNRIVPTSDSG